MTSILLDSEPPSPSRGVIALHSSSEWETILHSSNQVVLYNPKSHALSITHSSSNPDITDKNCPFCKRVLPKDFGSDDSEPLEFDEADPGRYSRNPQYFQLLSVVNESATGPPPLTAPEGDERGGTQSDGSSHAFLSNMMAEGYFERFFKEEYKLGMGANGSVYLCQHVLDGNPLGHFAVKKIAVGQSHSYLLQILQEVRLLEKLHHANIITYHHAWLETCQFSSFGPKVPTLHVLMEWAECGSLDDFIDIRLGRGSPHVHINPFGAFQSSPSPTASTASPQSLASRETPDDYGPDIHSRSARVRAFRAFQRAPPEEKERLRGKVPGKGARSLKAVHLLSAEEVKSLFQDVVRGLDFLHSRSILHLDLKPGNVLLTWDEGKLIPRAMLSDFGTSRDMIASNPVRSGNTGTLEYSSPESLPSPQTGRLLEISSKSDIWSLGMILHKLLFFRLPYRYAAAGDNGIPLSNGRSEERLGDDEKLKRLEQEVLDYPGFKATNELVVAFAARRLSKNYLILLESLLNKTPNLRPSCTRISMALDEGKLDLRKEPSNRSSLSSLVPLGHSVVRAEEDRKTPPFSITEFDSQVKEEEDVLLEHHDDVNLSVVSNDDNLTPRRKTSLLLGLPSPTDDSASARDNAPDLKNLNQIVSGRVGLKEKVLSGLVQHRILLVRLVKNIVLIGKVLSISTMCPGSYGFPRVGVISMLLGIALVDAVVDMHWLMHIGSLVFHVLVIKFGCTYIRCCT